MQVIAISEYTFAAKRLYYFRTVGNYIFYRSANEFIVVFVFLFTEYVRICMLQFTHTNERCSCIYYKLFIVPDALTFSEYSSVVQSAKMRGSMQNLIIKIIYILCYIMFYIYNKFQINCFCTKQQIQLFLYHSGSLSHFIISNHVVKPQLLFFQSISTAVNPPCFFHMHSILLTYKRLSPLLCFYKLVCNSLIWAETK